MAEKLAEIARKAADGIAAASALSRDQVEVVEQQRAEYLAAVPDMSDRQMQEHIQRNLGAVGVEVYQAYLQQLKHTYSPILIGGELDPANRIRYFDITKWVIDPKEKNLDKLANVYQVLSEESCNIALIYHRTPSDCRVTVAILNSDPAVHSPARANAYYARLASALRGNFPGAELRERSGAGGQFGIGVPECLQGIVDENAAAKSVAIVSNLASEKSEDFISQSMEKLLDGIVPAREEETYTLVLLAQPSADLQQRKTHLFQLYSALSPYATWQTSQTYTESDTEGSSATANANLGVGVNIGGSLKADFGCVKIGGSIGLTPNFGVGFSRSSNVSVSLGKNEGLTQTYTNFAVQHTLEVIKDQLKKLDESAALGLWEFAAYVISESPVITNNVAHMYLALTQGETSYRTNAAVNLWAGSRDQEQANAILQSLQVLQHPVFGLSVPAVAGTMDAGAGRDWLMYPAAVTASVLLSGKELARALNFPQKSVSGLPVLESTSFGREVQRFRADEGLEAQRGEAAVGSIRIGNVYHMRHKERTEVRLDTKSLASHVFVTGSTGTGKSNTVYQLLKELQRQCVHFLVVEPAKGEYKKIFGGKSRVYGTNIDRTELLCMNPFSFPADTHVLEHIDRLIELFNACWPMYAAMPAVLKDAVEKTYEKMGWNLRTSQCIPLQFPTFADLIETLPIVINSSQYSADTKSDYAGALITRVSSLTNGINGQIFCSGRELSAEDLFENDVIVDLSRVGSSETKSLMMGILVMKLQEYRMHLDQMNSDLVHVTVLEEAHNLLRRTSTDQSQEGANLQGKSVEMLTNSIAEMRTYGEGFIIADQAPELLDEAVIRNTNTKIVLRLPDRADREMVGTAMALTEEQITELAKLPTGVAAAYQNDWVEAVLCKFERFPEEEAAPLVYERPKYTDAFERYFLFVYGLRDSMELAQEEVDAIREWILDLRTNKLTRNILFAALKGVALSASHRETLSYNIFAGKKIAKVLSSELDPTVGIDQADGQIRAQLGCDNQALVGIIREHIMQVIFRETDSQGDLQRMYRTAGRSIV